MQDRVPLYPGRVTMTPVEGQANTYDMVRADQPTQAGTPLRKANLLKDTTAAQFGLGAGAVPDDVLSWLGKYNEYWWSLLHGQAYSYYTYTFNRTAVGTGSTEILKWTGTGAKTLYWADSVTGSGENNSKVILVDPQFKTYTLTTYNVDGKKAVGDELAADIPSLLGKYIKSSDSDTVYYVPSNATYPRSAGMGDYASYTIFALEKAVLGFYHDVDGDVSPLGQIVTAVPTVVNVPTGETTYEHSMNRNAYPDSGTVDGVTYTYLGVPFEKMPRIANIMTGVYTGTGVGGSGFPNIINTPFAAQMIFIQKNPSSINQVSLFATDTSPTGVFYGTVRSTDGYSDVTANNTFTFSSDSVSWYLSSASMSLSYFTDEGKATAQLNSANTSYRYLIIG